MEIGFDVIGDLFLSPDDEFNWDGKPTSLYCIVTGNISNDMGTLYKTLDVLSENYKGIFYTPGSFEYENCESVRKQTTEINQICKQVQNVASLWHHVVLLESIAILGCNGWSNLEKFDHHIDRLGAIELQFEDLVYLKNSIAKLQKHGDVKSMVIVTNSVPNKELHFGEESKSFSEHNSLDISLASDTENKITHWVYGSYGKAVDYKTNGITYISNPYRGIKPYWPKRINCYI